MVDIPFLMIQINQSNQKDGNLSSTVVNAFFAQRRNAEKQINFKQSFCRWRSTVGDRSRRTPVHMPNGHGFRLVTWIFRLQ